MGEDWEGGDGWVKEGGDDGESRWEECVVNVGKTRVGMERQRQGGME